ncbi:nucleotidyltransferase domain-containing protein [Streptomyces sp. NPDC005474]|uniref:nucleotidyltransferase domain-containing protein n=1 Tax=Streptomyces sp. NPDC005474 TaxID=3154878 RepID=UPI0034543091
MPESPPWISSVLCEATSGFLRSTSCIEVHLFGSVMRADSGKLGDVDILVVYEEGSLAFAHVFCNHLRSLTTHPPLDVIALSQKEEIETSFIATVGAKRIWPLL